MKQRATILAGATCIVSIFFIVLIPAAGHAENLPPLFLDVLVDSAIAISKGLSNGDALQEVVEDLIRRSSLIFNADIGRRIKLRLMEVKTAPLEIFDGGRLLLWPALDWVDGEADRRGSERLMYLMRYPLYDHLFTHKVYSGYAGQKSILVPYFSGDPQLTATFLLHELAHTCGFRRHSEDKDSLMHGTAQNGISYKEAIPFIRDRCGDPERSKAVD